MPRKPSSSARVSSVDPASNRGNRHSGTARGKPNGRPGPRNGHPPPKILDAAITLFADSGYGETGLADILQRAGVSRAPSITASTPKKQSPPPSSASFSYDSSMLSKGTSIPTVPPWRRSSAQHSRCSASCGRTCRSRSAMNYPKRSRRSAWPGRRCTAIGQSDSPKWWNSAVIAAGELGADVDPSDASEAIWAGVLGSPSGVGGVTRQPLRTPSPLLAGFATPFAAPT